MSDEPMFLYAGEYDTVEDAKEIERAIDSA